MSFDPVTEKISHFIGSFDMLVEQARMRDAYEEFRALLADRAEAGRLELLSYAAKHAYMLDGFEPDLKFKLILATEAQPASQAQPDTFEVSQISIDPASASDLVIPQEPLLTSSGDSTAKISFLIPLPPSVVTLAFQSVTLSDNDIFGDISALGFEALAPISLSLELLAELAEAASLFTLDGVTASTDWFALAEGISAAAQTLQDEITEDSPVFLVQGSEAASSFVNGAEVEALPILEDILPDYHADALAEAKAEDDDETSSLAAYQATDHDFSKDFEAPDQDVGTNNAPSAVVTGANTLVNSATVTSQMLDASVFAIGGNVLRFDAVTQVNVLVDHDGIGPGVDAFLAQGAPSQTINAAAIEELTVEEARREADREQDEDDNPNPGADSKKTSGEGSSQAIRDGEHARETSTPTNWTVVRHDGDVVQFNKVNQVSYASDMDQAAIVFTAATTFLGLGENNISNGFNTQQYGFDYDLVIVSGDMISVNLVDQVNVVLDSDAVHTDPDPQTAPMPASAKTTLAGQASTGQSGAAADPMLHRTEAATAPIGSNAAESSVSGQVTDGETKPLDTPGPAIPDSDNTLQSDPRSETDDITLNAPLGEAPNTANDPSGMEADVKNVAATISEPVQENHEGPEASPVLTEGAAAPAHLQTIQHAGDPAPGLEEDDADLNGKANGQDHAPGLTDGKGVANGLSTSDNLLFNKAGIKKIGKDTDEDLSETFLEAIESLADGAEDVTGNVAKDTLFDGIDFLRVLYVDGDFVTANALSQTNILGDSDQLHIAQDQFAAALQQQIEITTGSNVAANLASIRHNGQDSTVMAKGQTYSDALIHQANLVDTGVYPTDDLAFGISALANEAVAFLADGLIDQGLAEDIAAQAQSIIDQALNLPDGTDAILT